MESEVKEMKLEDDTPGVQALQNIPSASGLSRTDDDQYDGDTIRLGKASESPRKPESASYAIKPEKQEVIGGDITLKMEPGKAPKLSRATSQKVVARPPPLFSHLPDATADATSTFEVLSDCHYAAKYLGYTEPALDCDCTEQWGES